MQYPPLGPLGLPEFLTQKEHDPFDIKFKTENIDISTNFPTKAFKGCRQWRRQGAPGRSHRDTPSQWFLLLNCHHTKFFVFACQYSNHVCPPQKKKKRKKERNPHHVRLLKVPGSGEVATGGTGTFAPPPPPTKKKIVPPNCPRTKLPFACQYSNHVCPPPKKKKKKKKKNISPTCHPPPPIWNSWFRHWLQGKDNPIPSLRGSLFSR